MGKFTNLPRNVTKKIIKNEEYLRKQIEMKEKTMKIKIAKSQKLEENHIFKNEIGKNDYFFLD